MKVICEYCNKEIEKKPSDIYNHTFCSLKCMGSWRKNNDEYKKTLKGRSTKVRNLNKYVYYGKFVAIIATNGKTILIDKEDLEKVKPYTWRINKNGYAVTEYREDTNKTKRMQMHRLINNTPRKMITDHINRNKLDNRKSNLRTCTHSQNAMNVEKYRGTTSKIKGVSYEKRDRLWKAKITKNKITKEKRFKTEKEAIKQRIKWEKEYFGEFSTLGTKIILEESEEKK
ncbi:hypothetical protein FDB39_12505 [Clostridium botulinum]|nr:hypothetical protein [Clostridium botulinum]